MIYNNSLNAPTDEQFDNRMAQIENLHTIYNAHILKEINHLYIKDKQNKNSRSGNKS